MIHAIILMAMQQLGKNEGASDTRLELIWETLKTLNPLGVGVKEVLASFKLPNWQTAKARVVLRGKGLV